MRPRLPMLMLAAITTIIILIWIQSSVYKKNRRIKEQKIEKSIYYTSQSNVEMEPKRGNKNIIFLETRCVLHTQSSEQEGLDINPRQACTIESAARLNPDSTVHLLYSCPINGSLNASSKYVNELFSYSNIKIWKLDVSSFLAGTPLQSWNFRTHLKNSKWPVEHSSDVLRFASLWKYGGTYLDLDVLLIKPIDELGTNFIIKENENTIGSCVLNLEATGTGHIVTEMCNQDTVASFNGGVWSHNGPALLLRVFSKLCNTNELQEMTPEKCKGMKILSEMHFTPIYYPFWRSLFDSTEYRTTLEELQESYGVHMWNSISKSEKLNLLAKTPYGLLAKKFCPEVFTHTTHYF